MVQSPLKILFIITGLRYGGAEKLLYLTCKYLQQAYDVQIEIVYFDAYAPFKPLFEDLGIKLIRFPKSIFSYFFLRKHIYKESFDVIHTHLVHADLIGRLAALSIFSRPSTAIFATAHGTEWFRWRRTLYCALVRWIDRLLSLPQRSHIIAISGAVRDMLTHNQKIRPQKIILLYNAVEVPEKLPRKQRRQNHDILKLLYVGRLAAVKNIPCMLRAMALLSDLPLHLSIVGEGEMAAQLHQQVLNLNLQSRVEFLGARHDLAQLYESYDVLVLPSQNEGLGIVILEAFSHGMPVIGSNVDGIRELLSDGRGWLFKSDDARDLADKLKKFYLNSDQLHGTIEKTFGYVIKNHNIKNYVKNLWQIYQKAYNDDDV